MGRGNFLLPLLGIYTQQWNLVQKKVKASWEAVFKDSGITGVERTCFISCDEAIQQPEADAI